VDLSKLATLAREDVQTCWSPRSGARERRMIPLPGGQGLVIAR
jgi:hypothetical protein